MEIDKLEEMVLAQEAMLYRISLSILKNKEDAKDAVHDAILIAYQKIGTLKREEAFSSWLCRILVRCCYRILRERHRFIDVGEEFPDVASPDNPCLNVEVNEMLSSLPPKIRTVFLLSYVEGYSIKEIHTILGIPEGTVKSRLNAGRKYLEKWK
ncbi:MAG: RNA polymerase sigma factor [Clostridia bacterium]|nr:RNA polymerase sigma factor [Clostridia bacterium]